MAYYENIEKTNFLLEEDMMILAVRVETIHTSASVGDLWILNGCYPIRHVKNNIYIVIDGSNNPDKLEMNFKKHSGKFLKDHHPWTKEYLGAMFKQYYDPDSLLQNNLISA